MRVGLGLGLGVRVGLGVVSGGRIGVATQQRLAPMSSLKNPDSMEQSEIFFLSPFPAMLSVCLLLFVDSFVVIE